MSEEIIDTDGVQTLVGRTIITVHRDTPSTDPWPCYDESLTLTLDDGSVWRFAGEGYDASSLLVFRVHNDETA